MRCRQCHLQCSDGGFVWMQAEAWVPKPHLRRHFAGYILSKAGLAFLERAFVWAERCFLPCKCELATIQAHSFPSICVLWGYKLRLCNGEVQGEKPDCFEWLFHQAKTEEHGFDYRLWVVELSKVHGTSVCCNLEEWDKNKRLRYWLLIPIVAKSIPSLRFRSS